MKEYENFILTEDLNPAIRKGMQGVILEVLGESVYEVEFVNPDGTNITFNDEVTFTVKGSQMESSNSK